MATLSEPLVERHHGKTRSHMAFENASTNVAAAQMRNALTNLAETVEDPSQKKAGSAISPSLRLLDKVCRCSPLTQLA